jgi:quinol monooxygenase YgiN
VSQITVRARCVLRPDALGPFKALVHQLSALVRAHDHGTLRYDWYFNEDESVCVLIEAYESSEATLAHLGVVAPHLGALFSLCDAEFEVYGTPSPDLLAATARLPTRRFTPFELLRG